ncbi:MAG: hypothetical protein ACJATI_002979 [Halioglobus sp.]|jgi:hypothetical protein
MKIDIPYFIRQVLREQRKVYLPEIGTFILSQSPAQISDDKSRIHPPSLNILFDDDPSTDQSLKKYIQDTDKFSNSKINKAISDYTQSTFNKLINVNANKIKGIGTLVRSEAADKVSFEPSMDLFTKEYSGLTSLSIKPIDRIKENSTVGYVIDTQDQSVRAESRFRWLQPIVAGIMIAALFIMFVIMFKKCSERDAMLFNDPNEEVGTLEESNTNEITDASLEDVQTQSASELDKKYEEVDQMLEGTSIPDKTEAKLNEELKQLIDNSKSNKDTALITEPNTIGEIKVKSILKVSEVEKIVVSSKNYDDIIPESGKCIIILGSLKKARNITRMISLVEREGKKAYTSQYKGKTRVGFSFDCSDVDIDVYLNDIRERLSSKAWYLDPTVAIPYN